MELIVRAEEIHVVSEVDELIELETRIVDETIDLGVGGEVGAQGDDGEGLPVGPIATRPAAPDEGTVFIATDTDEVAVYLV
jgi:hypothetical protein